MSGEGYQQQVIYSLSCNTQKKRWDAIYIPLRGERYATCPLHRSLNSPWVLSLANFGNKVGIKTVPGGWVLIQPHKSNERVAMLCGTAMLCK